MKTKFKFFTKIFLFGFVVLIFCNFQGFAQNQPYDYVNTFIGTGEQGNTYPGAQAPFGMLSISPNNIFEDYEAARPGYKYAQEEIYGFGMTHFSGVGCHAMQDLPFLPVSGALAVSPVNNKSAYKSKFLHASEKAMPGFYAVKLDDYMVDTKFTTTQRAGIGELIFKDNSPHHIVFAPTNNANGISKGNLNIDPQHRRITGYMASGGFCWRNPADRPYTVYFVAEFDSPITTFGIWKGEKKEENKQTVSGTDIAAYVSLGEEEKTVMMRMAISYVSIENAIENMEAEIPVWDFDSTYINVKKDWANYLNKIVVEGGTVDDKAIFYTAIYHNLLQPNIFEDVNGSYFGFDDEVHTIKDGRSKYVNFSLWDTYRTTAYLQALLAPKASSDMINSLYLDAQQGGSFPNWSMNNQEYGVMNGYSPFPFIANMYAMGATDFDLEGVKNLMKTVSTEYHSSKGHHGWYNIEEYKTLGYVPIDKHGYGASMTLEYGIDDYSIAQICKAAGDIEGEKYYLNRSQNIFTLFNTENNFIQGRSADGKFITPFDSVTETGFNEGNATQYFWSIPQSMIKLIEKAGGNDKVEKRLDRFISKIETGWAPDKPYYWVGNEPCFGAVYVYNYLQKPWKAQYNVRRVASQFKNEPSGMPGDDDAGAMSALYAFSVIGLYPYLPGESGFTITGPLFDKITFMLKNHKKLTINAKGAGSNSPYIQSMKINGQKNQNLWLNWDEVNKGGAIEFTMGNKPNKKWGSKVKNRPPSYFPENIDQKDK